MTTHNSRTVKRAASRLLLMANLVLLPSSGCSTEGSSPEVAPEDSLGFSGRVPTYSPTTRSGVRLTLQKKLGDSTLFSGPSALHLVGEHLIVADRWTDPHLLALRLSTGTITARFGKRGGGPGEFRDPSWIHAVPESPGDFWVYDHKNLRLSRFELRRDGSILPVDELPLQLDATLESPVWVASDRIVSNGLFPDHSLVLLSSSGRPQERVMAELPFTEAEVPHPTARLQLNRNFLAFRPSDRRIALAYQFKSRVDFFRPDGSFVGSSLGPRQTRPDFELREGRFFWGPKNEMAYWAAFGTERFVYALFCGCKKEDQSMPTRIHVFRWNGDFVMELELDREIDTFTVAEDDSALIGTFEDPFPLVGIWPLPESLRT